MKIYSKNDKEFRVKYGGTLLIGFQQVITNPDKVFVWIRDTVVKPIALDRHHTTKLMNNRFMKVEWGKSVWTIDSVIEHLGRQLEKVDVTRDDLENLQHTLLCDKWRTSDDGKRNFVKAVISDPISEVSGARLQIQVTMSTSTPESILNRAYNEANGDVVKYNRLLRKYRERSIVRTYSTKYANIKGMLKPTKELLPVFIYKNGEKKLVYKETEIILGEPYHKFIEYEKEVFTPPKNINDIVNTLHKEVKPINKSFEYL